MNAVSMRSRRTRHRRCPAAGPGCNRGRRSRSQDRDRPPRCRDGRPRDRPGDVVGNGGLRPAFGADHRDDRPTGLASGGEQPADRADDVERADRRAGVADPAPHHRGEQRRCAADPTTGAGVAHLGGRSRPPDIVTAALGLDHGDVGRRRAAIGFDRSGDPPLRSEVGLVGADPRRPPGWRRRSRRSRKRPGSRLRRQRVLAGGLDLGWFGVRCVCHYLPIITCQDHLPRSLVLRKVMSGLIVWVVSPR